LVALLFLLFFCCSLFLISRIYLPTQNFLFLTEADDAPVKIIDFGLSRHDDTDLGIMQTKVGTPYYVAPGEFGPL